VFEIERERGQSAAVRDVRHFSSSIAYRVKKKKERKREKEKDRFSLPFFAHFAFLHLLFSRNVLGVVAASAAILRRKNIDNNQRMIYVVVVFIVLLRNKKNKNSCP
jgi:hypothetical protein